MTQYDWRDLREADEGADRRGHQAGPLKPERRDAPARRSTSAGSRIRPTSALNNTGMALCREALTSDEQSTRQEMQMRRTFALAVLALMARGRQRVRPRRSPDAGKDHRRRHQQADPERRRSPSTRSTGHNVHNEYKADKDGDYRFLSSTARSSTSSPSSADGYAPIEYTMKPTLGDINTKDVDAGAGRRGRGGRRGAAGREGRTRPSLAYNEGAALANEGKLPEAIAKIEEAVAAKPDLTAGYEALAKLYLRTKNYDKAIDRANKALEIDTDNQDMFSVLRGRVHGQGRQGQGRRVPEEAAGRRHVDVQRSRAASSTAARTAKRSRCSSAPSPRTTSSRRPTTSSA